MDTASSPRIQIRSARIEVAAERRSERMDTAYSPRLHEEEPSAAADFAFGLRQYDIISTSCES